MKVLYVLVLFMTLGLALSRDFFATLGYQASYPMIAAFGAALVTQLMHRSSVAILAVALLAVMVTVTRERLESYGLDHEILLALVLTTILYPWIRKVGSD
jgi:hypothetical protein